MAKKCDKKENLKKINELPEGYLKYLECMGIKLVPYQKECICRILKERKKSNTIPQILKSDYMPLHLNGGAK